MKAHACNIVLILHAFLKTNEPIAFENIYRYNTIMAEANTRLWLNENVIFPAHWIIFTQKTFEEKYKLYNTNIITRIKIVASRFE